MKTKLFFLITIVAFSLKGNAQWQKLSGPFGAKIKSIGVNDSTVFAVSYYGIYKTINNGDLWTDEFMQNVQDIVVKDSIIFIATFGQGVFKSTDNGMTWTAVNSGLSLMNNNNDNENQQSQKDIMLTPNITCLAILGNKIYAGTYGSGIYISSIDNVYWSAINNGISDWDIHSIAAHDSIVVAGTLDGVFISTNYGSSWLLSNNGIPNGQWCTTFAFYGDTLFAGNLADGLYYSSNLGLQWNYVNLGISTAQSQEINTILVYNNSIYVGTWAGIFKSDDGGITWLQNNNGLFNTNVFALKSKGNNIFAGTQAGMFISTDNSLSWSVKNNGIIGGDILSLNVTNSIIYAGTSFGGFFSSDNGLTWLPFGGNSLDNENITAMFARDTVFLAGTYGGSGMFLSTNNTSSWSSVLPGRDIWCFAESGGNLFAGTSYGIFRSTNNGFTWSHISNIYTRVQAMVSSGNSVYAGKFSGGIYSTTNNGSTWQLISNGIPSTLGVLSMTICDTNIFAGTYGGGVYLSTNQGSSWSQKNNGLQNGNITAMATFYSKIVICTNVGVYATDNFGTNWTLYNDGLEGTTTQCLASDDSYIYIGTSGSGIWRRPKSEIVGLNNISDNFKLDIYPNPTTNQLNIETNTNSKQNLEIINIVGQTIYNSTIDKNIKIDVSKFPKGIYFIKLNSETSTTIKKFIKD